MLSNSLAVTTEIQTAETIAQALVEVITRHGVPAKFLSDRGANFLSEILQDVYELLGIKKVNTHKATV